MSTIDIKQIEHLAKLSRLGLKEGEKESLAKDLGYFGICGKIGPADVSGVLPTSNAAELLMRCGKTRWINMTSKKNWWKPRRRAR